MFLHCNQRSGQITTRRLKIKSMMIQKDKVVFVVQQSLLNPDRSVWPRMLLVTSVERKDITKSAARAKQVNKVQLVNLGRFKYMVYKRRINVVPLYLHKSLFGDKSLTPASVQIFGYGESPVASLGECTIAIHTGVVFTIEQSSRT